MNYCIIDGRKAYPALSQSIKVTYENPLIKDRDAQSMEIEFPLSIMANRELFGSLDRIDVSKHVATFQNCILYAGPLCVLRGRGTVTSITDKSVKVQIKSGISTSEYSEWNDVYIDEMEYDEITILEDREGITWIREDETSGADSYKLPFVYDETNDRILNICIYYHTVTAPKEIWREWYPSLAAPQPRLVYILRTVLKNCGYTLKVGILDNEPWANIYIFNNKITKFISKALPHWSVKTFLQEIKKVFNISFTFDEAQKTVDIVRRTYDGNASEFECFDEYSTEYDEDGLEYIGASNLSYNFSDSDGWEYPDLDEKTITAFPIKSYMSYSQALEAAESMSKKERLTTLFKVLDEYYCVKPSDDSKVEMQGPLGGFQHLTRQKGSENDVVFKCVPVAFQAAKPKYDLYLSYPREIGGLPINFEYPMPSGKASETDTSYMKDGEDFYIPVAEALEDGDTSVEEAERMELYFISSTNMSFHIKDEIHNKEYECPHHNCQIDGSYGSFKLNKPGASNKTDYIGRFHDNAKLIENREQIVIKFIIDGIPDVKKTFMFRGKRFLCDKVEMNVTEKGLDRVATGYFYELNN